MIQASGHSEGGAWGSIVLGCLAGGSEVSSLVSVAGLSSTILRWIGSLKSECESFQLGRGSWHVRLNLYHKHLDASLVSVAIFLDVVQHLNPNAQTRKSFGRLGFSIK
jgi:hypothetical protein